MFQENIYISKRTARLVGFICSSLSSIKTEGRAENIGTLANSFPHAELSLRLKEFTEGVVTIGAIYRFVTVQAMPHGWIKNEAGV